MRDQDIEAKDTSTTTATNTTATKKLDELHELIAEIETAMLTTRRGDGMLVTRPMATQQRGPLGDLWFVTSIETHKVEEIRANPDVCVGYYDDGTKEWVSVSGRATISQDRDKIHELYQKDWKAWFGEEGGNRDGGPDDPRLALIIIDAQAAHYMKARHGKVRTLFEIAKGRATGKTPDVGREEHLTGGELR
ncbi:MAG: pyridoxamine 5'-phosphate oxidase family protein [Phycisphaerales bacterium JB060]